MPYKKEGINPTRFVLLEICSTLIFIFTEFSVALKLSEKKAKTQERVPCSLSKTSARPPQFPPPQDFQHVFSPSEGIIQH